MNSVDIQSPYEIITLQSNRNSRPQTKSAATQCHRCGNSISRTKVITEFGTIQLDDIYAGSCPDPQRSSKTSNNNEADAEDTGYCKDKEDIDLCIHCANGTSKNHKNGIKTEVKPTFMNGGNPESSSMIQVEFQPNPVLVHASPASVITSYGHSQSQSQETSSILVNEKPTHIPITVVLPNGLRTEWNGISNFQNSGSHLSTFSCTLCSKIFKNERLATAHQDKHHSNLARYSCPTCNGKFCYRGALNAHISIQHPQLPSHNCGACGKTFKEKSNLNAHTTLAHTKPRLFKCEFCDSAFSKKVNLNYHQKRKHLEGSEVPPQNNGMNSVQEEADGNVHEKGVGFEGNPNLMSGNSEMAGKQELEANHLEMSAGGGSEKKVGSGTSQTKAEGDFKCQYCGRGFLFRNNLKCHLRTHIRDKKYTCEICEKSFIYKESLKNHMLLHSNELPYQCDICLKKFRDRSNRRKHVKNVHKSVIGSNASGAGASSLPVASETNAQAHFSPSDPATAPPKRRRRPPVKKKNSSPPTVSIPGSASPPKGVIVSPNQNSHILPNLGTGNGIPLAKSELMSPPSHEHEYHHQPTHLRHQHYLPPSMQHPNVIVYPKTKSEPAQLVYNERGVGSPPESQPHVHGVIASHPQPSYYEPYVHAQQQEAMQYSSLMAPPQSISPENNTGDSRSYDSPSSPYVINMSMLPPGSRGRSNSTNTTQDVQITNVYSTPPSASLMYSSPLMGMDPGEEYGQYWITPGANETQESRSYYQSPEAHSHPVTTVTEGTLLHPQSPYINSSPAPPTQAPPYFYTDLTQFDLSHL